MDNRSPPISRSRSSEQATKGLSLVIGPLKRSSGESLGVGKFVNCARVSNPSPRFMSTTAGPLLQRELINRRLARLEKPGIDELPEECCSLQILLRCDLSTCLNLRQTCRMWYRRSLHPGLWEYFAYLRWDTDVFSLLDPISYHTDWLKLFQRAYVGTKNLENNKNQYYETSTFINPEEEISGQFYIDGARLLIAQEEKLHTISLLDSSSTFFSLPSKIEYFSVQLPYFCVSTSPLPGKNSIHLWNTKDEKNITSWGYDLERPVRNITIPPTYDTIIASSGSFLYLWDFEGKEIQKFESNEQIESIHLIDQHHILTSNKNFLTLWSRKIGKSIWEIPIEKDSKFWYLFPKNDLSSPKLFLYKNQSLEIYNVLKTILIKKITDAFQSPIQNCFYWKNYFIICLKEKEIQIWDEKLENCVHFFKTKIEISVSYQIHNFLFFSDSYSVFFISLEKNIKNQENQENRENKKNENEKKEEEKNEENKKNEETEENEQFLFKSEKEIIQIRATLSRCICKTKDERIFQLKF